MDTDFEFFYDWVKKNLGLDLDAYKETQLQRRITTVMRSAGATNLKDYAKLIESDQKIKRAFLDYITINVTEFFRNKDIFHDFEGVLKDILLPRFKSIKIWSAACSIGAEPYSLAILMDKYNIPLDSKIMATDIDEPILHRAKLGIYNDYEIKNLPKEDLDNYFISHEKAYKVKDRIRNMVSFKKHDLLQDKYDKGYHVVLCRNVTIYFKNYARDQIYKKMSESLVSGGILFTGATESIYNPSEFGFRKLSTFIYEKI